MCVGENLLLTFLKTVSLPRKIFVKPWAVHLCTVAERQKGTQKKPNWIFFFFSTKIKSNATWRSKFFLFSPETRSDNENRDKTVLGVIANLIFLLLFQWSKCFPFSTDPVFTPAVLPSDILRCQVSSPDIDSTKIIWKRVHSMRRMGSKQNLWRAKGMTRRLPAALRTTICTS